MPSRHETCTNALWTCLCEVVLLCQGVKLAVSGGAASAAELRTLRRQLLRIAEAILHSALASQARVAAEGLPSGQPPPKPLLAHDDVQALVAFLGDCSDIAVVEDVAVSLAGMMQPASYLRRALTTSLQVAPQRAMLEMLPYAYCMRCQSCLCKLRRTVEGCACFPGY